MRAWPHFARWAIVDVFSGEVRFFDQVVPLFLCLSGSELVREVGLLSEI